MITQIDDYFALGCGRCERFATEACSTKPWNKGLRALRQICLDLQLVEAVKWGHPCYLHNNRNVAIIGATRNDFRLSFFQAALMSDPEHVLERQGVNTKYADMIRFTANEQVEACEAVIRVYLMEAKGYADAGLKTPKAESNLTLPEELEEALAADPELSMAFHCLTPGRQRSYVLRLNSAKKPVTRIARVLAFRNRILAGKGATER